jgi:hypothetical protein
MSISPAKSAPLQSPANNSHDAEVQQVPKSAKCSFVRNRAPLLLPGSNDRSKSSSAASLGMEKYYHYRSARNCKRLRTKLARRESQTISLHGVRQLTGAIPLDVTPDSTSLRPGHNLSSNSQHARNYSAGSPYFIVALRLLSITANQKFIGSQTLRESSGVVGEHP